MKTIKVFTENVKVTIEDDFKLATKYFKEMANVDFAFEFENIKLKNKTVFLNPNVNAYSIEGFNSEIPAKDEYMDIYAFNAEDYKDVLTTSKMIGFSKPYTSLMSLKTNPSDDSIGWIWKSIVHEIMHGLFQKAYFAGFRGMIDQMDKTLVNGVWIDYYKNNDPYALDGNHAVCLKILEPYLATLRENNYKYFSKAEVAKWKLKPELWTLLDKMREECGFPFIINSGLRTKEENDKLKDSASDSAHLSGLAVDISIKDSTKRYILVKVALNNGINRIGIADTFVHIDVDKTKPQNVIWNYY